MDDYFGKALSYFVKKKSQMGTIVDNLLMILKAASYNVQYQRCNNAGENVKGLTNTFVKHNIKIEFTVVPYTPQQNHGIVERKFVTICQRACAAMFAASFQMNSKVFCGQRLLVALLHAYQTVWHRPKMSKVLTNFFMDVPSY